MDSIERLKTDFETCGWYKNDGICQRGKEAFAIIEQLQAENKELRAMLDEIWVMLETQLYHLEKWKAVLRKLGKMQNKDLALKGGE